MAFAALVSQAMESGRRGQRALAVIYHERGRFIAMRYDPTVQLTPEARFMFACYRRVIERVLGRHTKVTTTLLTTANGCDKMVKR